jgi:hypothetical protein
MLVPARVRSPLKATSQLHAQQQVVQLAVLATSFVQSTNFGSGTQSTLFEVRANHFLLLSLRSQSFAAKI